MIELRHLLGREVQVVHAELSGFAQEVVIDVGDVSNASNFMSLIDEPTFQHVKREIDKRVTEVS
jgi:hypothetical protein